jgi:hypothetical protein
LRRPSGHEFLKVVRTAERLIHIIIVVILVAIIIVDRD